MLYTIKNIHHSITKKNKYSSNISILISFLLKELLTIALNIKGGDYYLVFDFLYFFQNTINKIKNTIKAIPKITAKTTHNGANNNTVAIALAAL